TPADGATRSTRADCVPVHENDVVARPVASSDGMRGELSSTSSRSGSNPGAATSRSAVSGEETDRHEEAKLAIGGAPPKRNRRIGCGPRTGGPGRGWKR